MSILRLYASGRRKLNLLVFAHRNPLIASRHLYLDQRKKALLIWGKALPTSGGSEALVLDMAMPMPTIYNSCCTSGLYLLITCSFRAFLDI